MKNIFIIFVLAINILYSNTQNSSNDTNNTQNSEIEYNKDVGLFAPAQVIKDSYGAFMIGYELLNKQSPNIGRESKQGIFFALDKGWNFVDNVLLFGFSLDGSAGSFYSLNINAKLGARIFDGRIIPSISFGYGLLNHFVGDTQYNLHGGNGMISFFIDIMRGFGLEVSYRVGLHPFRATKKNSNIKVDNINALMINFKFIDFSI
ncbi:hypothetical protein CCY99_07485 [Helicobacter sp. 16-1353]|uniref:hypothetical protein n=1 Tax=Helicobacter sp. 16-1353 TaxID=2004996 RepID=UPI000DCC10F1|nr:hypothetical protein [Helicobacter sp. 16-1353]RAX52479.1 hypothetical protein CCY99_07485 [Helicobacter sp. 16-1353]